MLLDLIACHMVMNELEVVASVNYESHVPLFSILFVVTFSFIVKKQAGNNI